MNRAISGLIFAGVLLIGLLPAAALPATPTPFPTRTPGPYPTRTPSRTPQASSTPTPAAHVFTIDETHYIGQISFVNIVLVNSLIDFEKLLTDTSTLPVDFVTEGIKHASLWGTMDEYADLLIFPPSYFRSFHGEWSAVLDDLGSASALCVAAVQAFSRTVMDNCVRSFQTAGADLFDVMETFSTMTDGWRLQA